MNVFAVVFPVIAVAALGWLARHRNWLSVAEQAAVERLSFWFLLPCLLFLGTATAEFPAAMDWGYLGGFYLTLVLVYLFGMALGRLLFGYELRALAVFGMGGVYSNVSVLGIPVTVAVLGEAAFVPLFIIIAVHNLLLFAFGTLLAEWRSGSGTTAGANLWRVGREMVLNPVSGSLLAGALWNLLGLPLYAPLRDTLALLSQAAIPGALFALGAGLTRYQVRGEIPAALTLVVVKLVILPLAMWYMMTRVFAVGELWAHTAVLMSAMPVGISVYVFSRYHHSCEAQVAAAIVLSSLGSVVTVSLLVGLLHWG